MCLVRLAAAVGVLLARHEDVQDCVSRSPSIAAPATAGRLCVRFCCRQFSAASAHVAAIRRCQHHLRLVCEVAAAAATGGQRRSGIPGLVQGHAVCGIRHCAGEDKILETIKALNEGILVRHQLEVTLVQSKEQLVLLQLRSLLSGTR